jgi:hypothetical protein
MWRHFADEFHALARIFTNAFTGYRPELHYMRGPGPKWHAKHGAEPLGRGAQPKSAI